MVQDDGKRNFALIEDSAETSVYAGNMPRQAAMKAARRLDVGGRSGAPAPRTELRLRERGTDTIHVYDAWAWEDPSPVDGPAWLGDTVPEATVSTQGGEHQDISSSGQTL